MRMISLNTRFILTLTSILLAILGSMMVSRSSRYCEYTERFKQQEEWIEGLLIISQKLNNRLEELSQRISKVESRREQNVRAK